MELDSSGNDSEFLIATRANGTHEHLLAPGERRLWLEVLRVAIGDLIETGRCPGVGDSQQSLRQEAEKWIHSSEHGTGSFHWICMLFDVDPTPAREKLLTMSQEELKGVLSRLPTYNPGKSNQHQLSTQLHRGSRGLTVGHHLAQSNGARVKARDMGNNGWVGSAPKPEPMVTSSAESATTPENIQQTADEPNAVDELHLSGAIAPADVQIDHSERRRTMSTQDHLKWLRDQLDGYEAELHQAAAEASRLKHLVATLAATVEALGGANGNGKPANNGRNGHGRPAQAASDLKRIHEVLSVTDAIKAILDAQDGWIHQDQITRKVFDVGDDTSAFKRAKQSLTSSLAAGAKRGLWKALGDGRWAKNGYQRPEQGDGGIPAAAGS